MEQILVKATKTFMVEREIKTPDSKPFLLSPILAKQLKANGMVEFAETKQNVPSAATGEKQSVSPVAPVSKPKTLTSSKTGGNKRKTGA